MFLENVKTLRAGRIELEQLCYCKWQLLFGQPVMNYSAGLMDVPLYNLWGMLLMV